MNGLKALKYPPQGRTTGELSIASSNTFVANTNRPALWFFNSIILYSRSKFAVT